MSGDNLESYIDLSEFDPVSQLSPSLSPSAAKSPFARTTPTVTSAPQTIIPPAQQSFSGPSHQYDLYKQQTGLVPGAVASTLAVNQANSQVSGSWEMSIGSGLSPEDGFDFNTAPSQGGSMSTPDMDVDFGSPDTESFLFADSTINPNAIGGQESPVLPSQSSNVGRMWPGMHQQAALAKAQAQQRQQQQIIQQQQQQRQAQQQNQAQHTKRPSKSAQHSDPIVEQKITQLLNSMRAKPALDQNGNGMPMLNLPRPKKEEDDMDEDERLLASEEGKKLSSKERRQLRNKVSARAFRSRRKEYISQLESEIANKVTENGDLRAQNRALLEENKRLSDLTRMLLSSPSFSNFLEHLSSNPQATPQPEPQRQPEAQRQLPKDVNPYAAGQVNQHQQIGMAMIPEQNLDFNMLAMDTSIPSDGGFNFQPQVYNAILDTPEIDTSVLSGKASNFVTEEDDDDESKDSIKIERDEKPMMTEVPSDAVDEPELDEDDETFELYRSPVSPIACAQPATITLSEERETEEAIFGGIEAEKVFARYELVEPTEAEAKAAAEELAVLKFDRLCARLDASLNRMEKLCFE